MCSTYKKQQGITLISLVFLLGILGFFTLLALKIGPIYMNHSKVMHALETLKNRPDIENHSKREVRSALIKQFNMNYVDHIKKDDVMITSHYGYLKVQIKYHVKQVILANISAWVDFDNEIEVGTL